MNNKLLIFSPVPPLMNGIADYVGELHPYLSQYFDILYVVNSSAELAFEKSMLYSEYLSRLEEFSKYRRLFHIGNNKDHLYLLEEFLLRPGVLVVHDYNLSWLARLGVQNSPRAKELSSILLSAYIGTKANSNIDGAGLYQFIEKFGFCLPFTDFLSLLAKHVVCHSDFVFKRLPINKNKKSLVLHHASPSAYPKTIKRSLAKTSLGIKPGIFVILFIGFMGSNKQIPRALSALAEFLKEKKDVLVLLAGEERPEEVNLRECIFNLGLNSSVRFSGYVKEDEFFTYISSADVVVNLRYPSPGESSGVLVRSMAVGRVSIVSDIGTFSEADDICADKIKWDDCFPANFCDAVVRLYSNPAKKLSRERSIVEYCKKHHSIVNSAEVYKDAVLN